MPSFRPALAVLILAVASPALAEEPAQSFGSTASTELPQTLRIPVSVLAQAGTAPEQATPSRKVKRKNPECNANGCGYKALLGGIAIAKDIDATENVSVRVLPTNSSLGGETRAPILVRARVDGQYGFHLRAKF